MNKFSDYYFSLCFLALSLCLSFNFIVTLYRYSSVVHFENGDLKFLLHLSGIIFIIVMIAWLAGGRRLLLCVAVGR